MIKLVALGDICPGDHYFSLGHGFGARFAAGARPLAPVAPLLRSADLVIGNLEGPLARRSVHRDTVEAAVFRGPPEAAQALAADGVSALSVANNHIYQHGIGAFATTLHALHCAGVAPVGLGNGNGPCAPILREIAGLRLALLGYSLVPERHDPGQRGYATPTIDAMLAQVRDMAARVDLVVVSIHWGEEGVELPSPQVVATAHALVDAGASLILGHHPHVFQPVVRIKNAIVAYSLGDTLFDLFWHRPLIESALLQITIAPERQPVLDFQLIPVGLGRDYQLHPLHRWAARRFLRGLVLATEALQLPQERYEIIFARQRARSERAAPWRKLPFFVANLWRGDVRSKAGFVLRKVSARWAQ